MEDEIDVSGTEVTVNGVRLAYSDVGNGLPLVCLHGGMGIDAGSLRVPGVLALAGAGMRLIIPDQRGHGRSSRSAPNAYTHGTWATDVRHLAHTLDLQRFALLGHSYGGFVALEYAKRWPESLTHLVLVATSAGPVVARAADVMTDADLREHFRRIWPFFFAGTDKHWPLVRVPRVFSRRLQGSVRTRAPSVRCSERRGSTRRTDIAHRRPARCVSVSHGVAC